MPKNEGYYGSYGGSASPGTEKFQPAGEPDSRDKRGSIEGSGVPASAERLPVEPDTKPGPNPFEPGSAEVIRRATNEKVQPIEKPIADPNIVGGSDAALPVEPGV